MPRNKQKKKEKKKVRKEVRPRNSGGLLSAAKDVVVKRDSASLLKLLKKAVADLFGRKNAAHY